MRRRWKILLPVTVLATAGIVLGFVYVDSPDRIVDRLRYPLHYDALVREQAGRFDLDGALVAAVIYQESRFDANARSEVGAIGLMQLMPITGRTIARWTGGKKFEVDDLYQPELNVRYGTWYLHYLLEKYKDEKLALAAYHAGETNVDEWIRDGRGIVFADTRAYVAAVANAKKQYRRLYGSRLRVS